MNSVVRQVGAVFEVFGGQGGVEASRRWFSRMWMAIQRSIPRLSNLVAQVLAIVTVMWMVRCV